MVAAHRAMELIQSTRMSSDTLRHIINMWERKEKSKALKKMSKSFRFAHMFGKSNGLVKKWSEIMVGLMAT